MLCSQKIELSAVTIDSDLLLDTKHMMLRSKAMLNTSYEVAEGYGVRARADFRETWVEPVLSCSLERCGSCFSSSTPLSVHLSCAHDSFHSCL